MRYVSLHHHSTFSYMDGYGTPEQHVDRAAELDMGALALTEHGNVSSHVRLEKQARAVGLQPIFGLEAYTGPEDMRETGNKRKWHLTILAADAEGYHNLNRLVTRSWAEGFYQWPTITGSMLADHHEGLIVLSGCADSKLACDLLGGKGRETGSEHDAIRTLTGFRDLLGDRYYMEVQQFPELERTRRINPWYAQASRRYGVPLVATADCHYPLPTDNEMQKVLHAAGRGTGTVETAEASWEYGIRLTHPTSDAEVLDRLRRTGLSRRDANGALAATAEIASRCNVELPKAGKLRFPVPAGYADSTEYIWDLLRKGWEYRAQTNRNLIKHEAEYVDRLRYEMGLITSKDYVDYFVMLADLVSWAKDQHIPVGPARGSAAASLVCYLLRITEIDAPQFPIMMFERFIDVTRDDLPDIDLDFDDEQRDRLRLRAIEVYGEENVGNIGTFTKYRGKNALIDVARVHNIPGWEIEKVKALVVNRSGGDSRVDDTLGDMVEIFPQAKEVFDLYPNLWKAVALEGNYRGMGVHAAGLIISPTPLNDVCAVYTRMSAGVERQVVSVDKYDAEYLGLLKADFLGLSTMGAISHALRMIGMTLEELYALSLDDAATIDAFRRNDVTGIFQFTGGSTRIVCGDVKPDNFGELCDINALSRPGPLHSGSTNEYINVKHKRGKPVRMHPFIDQITRPTKGQIIYQEQILAIIRELGGLPWAQVAHIRKVISLKKGIGEFNKSLDAFQQGCLDRHGIPHEMSRMIWNRIVTSGQYAFNAAHCVSYAMLAYWCMWVKVHYPQAFYASHLRKFPDDEYALLRDGIAHGLTFVPPDLNHSTESWEPDPESETVVRAGFLQLPGIGAKTATTILDSREHDGPFRDYADLQRIPGIGPKTVANIQEFAHKDDPFGIHRIERLLEPVRAALADGSLGDGRLPVPTHKGGEIPTDAQNIRVTYLGVPFMRNPQNVVEDERARTGADMETVRRNMKHPDLDKKMVVRCYDDTDRTVYVRFSRFDFPKFERALWDMTLEESVMLVRGVKRGGFGTGIHVEKLWIIDP